MSNLTAEQLTSLGGYFRNYQPGVGDLVTPVDPGFLLGSIIWPKSLGKPLSSDLTGGFSILLKFSQSVFDFTPPAHFIELPVVLVIDGKYDATRPEDEDYNVGFVASGLSNDEASSHRTTYAVEVSLRTDVNWTNEVPFIRRFVSPRVRTFQKGTASVWLEPFRVLKRSGVELIPGVLS
ncbi:MAG: hypothetical protein ABIQ30_14790 [Devosia sp.]